MWLPKKFESVGLSVQYRFSRWQLCWISSQNDFCFWTTSQLNTSNIWSGEKVQNRFSIGLVWDHLGFLIRMISYFWSTSHLDTSCHISLESVGLSVQEKMFKIDFQDWRPSCISDRHGFHCFLTYNHPDAFYQVKSQLAIWFRRSAK